MYHYVYLYHMMCQSLIINHFIYHLSYHILYILYHIISDSYHIMIKIQLIHHIISSYLMVTGDSSLRFQHTMNEESYLLYPLNHFRLVIRVFALHHALFFSPKEKILELFCTRSSPECFARFCPNPNRNRVTAIANVADVRGQVIV